MFPHPEDHEYIDFEEGSKAIKPLHQQNDNG
jgi:hypothetical protein